MMMRILHAMTLCATVGCTPERPPAQTEGSPVREPSTARQEPIQPLPSAPVQDPELVDLGGRLFHDTRLSVDGTVSCHSCHNIAQGGDDGLAFSVGVGGAIGAINAPTVLNSGLNIAQFWDGRAATLHEQVNGPVTHPAEMGANWEDVVQVLAADPGIAEAFERTLSQPVSQHGIQTAIAAYEQSLLTPNSPFDTWLLGDDEALDDAARRGYARFKEYGCVACHQGRNVGGNMYQTFGLFDDYFANRGNITEADLGRFAVTGDEADRHRFRVPSLRNVALTAPYFHDGSAQDLDTAVRVMAQYQLGRQIPEQDTQDIVAFLHTLTGDLPDTARYLP